MYMYLSLKHTILPGSHLHPINIHVQLLFKNLVHVHVPHSIRGPFLASYARLWNSLPASVVDVPSGQSFKSNVHHHLINLPPAQNTRIQTLAWASLRLLVLLGSVLIFFKFNKNPSNCTWTYVARKWDGHRKYKQIYSKFTCTAIFKKRVTWPLLLPCISHFFYYYI